MTLPIVHYDSPVLRKKGAPVRLFDDALKKLSAQMVETMHKAGGIGLAAQQIGQALQLCVVDLRETDAEFTWTLDGVALPLELFMPMVIANPKVKLLPGEKEIYEEGCLSFPGIRGEVERVENIRVDYQDENGVTHALVCDGLFGRCIQHEVDHLNGVLFIDRMKKKILKDITADIEQLRTKTVSEGG